MAAGPPDVMGDATLTVNQARRALTAALQAAGVDAPSLDARILIGHGLGLDHAGLVAAARRQIEPEQRDRIAALIRRRLDGEPVARIVEQKEFWSLPFRISPATLLPRPETETVVEAALATLNARGSRSRAWRIADLGTGCGALILALLSELPNAVGTATDIDLEALSVARENAGRLGLVDRAAFLVCDMAQALRGPFDLIVSNPPYIASDEIAGLAPEVRDFDPRLALDGGADGLDPYRAIAEAAPRCLASDGAVVVELGAGRTESVAAIFAAAGLAPLPPHSDLSDMPRALVGRKRS